MQRMPFLPVIFDKAQPQYRTWQVQSSTGLTVRRRSGPARCSRTPRVRGMMCGMSEGGIPGAGLAKGLAVTLKTMVRRSVTQQYPDVAPDLPPRSRGVIALLEENCTV